MTKPLTRARVAWLVLVLAGAAMAACSAILGIDEPPSADGADASTSTTADAPSSADATGAADGSPDAPEATAVCVPLGAATGMVDAVAYTPFAQAPIDDAGTMAWNFFDLTSIPSPYSKVNPINPAFAGGTFDGQYIYFVGRSPWIVRYDTKAGGGAFAGGMTADGGSAWSSVNVSILEGSSAPESFLGAVFDGQFVYFVPGGTSVSTAFRYDTLGAGFGAAASWSSFDLETLSTDGGAALSGFFSGVFDGRYVYYVPHNDGVYDGRVARYDTMDAGAGRDAGDGGVVNTFADMARWSTFDVSSTSPQAAGFSGGVFDGKSIYLVPTANSAFGSAVHAGTDGVVARYTIGESFTAAASWSTFDMTRVNGLAENYVGGAFDGRYVYFVPRSSGVIVRFDSQASSFANLGAWSYYDATKIIQRDGGAPFAGAAFDGRFVYFVPTTSPFATVARYDTSSPFTADCAWSTIDLGQVDPAGDAGPQNFIGAVFDGQYVYLIPTGNGLVARFYARSLPAARPFRASFL